MTGLVTSTPPAASWTFVLAVAAVLVLLLALASVAATKGGWKP